jgi:hypothetical protein
MTLKSKHTEEHTVQTVLRGILYLEVHRASDGIEKKKSGRVEVYIDGSETERPGRLTSCDSGVSRRAEAICTSAAMISVATLQGPDYSTLYS